MKKSIADLKEFNVNTKPTTGTDCGGCNCSGCGGCGSGNCGPGGQPKQTGASCGTSCSNGSCGQSCQGGSCGHC